MFDRAPPTGWKEQRRKIRSNSISLLHSQLSYYRSKCDPTINHEGRARRVLGLITRKIKRHGCDFFGRTEPSHWLPCDKVLPGQFRVVERCYAGFQGRALHGAWANTIASYALRDVVSRNRLRQTDDCRLACPINEAARQTTQRRGNGRHIDYRPITCRQHARQEGSYRPVHGFNIEVKRKIPVFFLNIQDTAMVNETGDITKNIDRPHRCREIGDRIAICHIKIFVFIPTMPVTLSKASPSMSVAITSAPSTANSVAIAFPMPRAAAVTTTFLFSSLPDTLHLL